MSYSTVLAIAPGRSPAHLLELRNSHGWAPSIWNRLLHYHNEPESWFRDESALRGLCDGIDHLPEWQQAPLILTFDLGVIPGTACEWAADQLEKFDFFCPAPAGYVNHVPAVVGLLRTNPEGAPFIGVWVTSVTDNPFDPWDYEADEPGKGVPLRDMYLLERHREPMEMG